MMHYVLLVNELDPSWKDETLLQSLGEKDADMSVEVTSVRRSHNSDTI